MWIGEQIFRLTALKNLEIHKVFLRFFVLPDEKSAAETRAGIDSVVP